jgi:Skp family chaperone for outer membrane proteins
MDKRKARMSLGSRTARRAQGNPNVRTMLAKRREAQHAAEKRAAQERQRVLETIYAAFRTGALNGGIVTHLNGTETER